MKKIWRNKKIGLLSVIVWLVIWQVLSFFLSKILLAGPLETAASLFRMMKSQSFYQVMLISTFRILAGFLLSVILAGFAAGLSAKSKMLYEFLRLPVQLMKSVPVASLVVIALLWLGSEKLSALIVFLIVFPIVYSSVYAEIGNVDSKMIEMAKTNHYTIRNRIRYIYLPDMYDPVRETILLACGMAFKAGVSAEIIAQPSVSIGEKIYFAKLYFSTGELFAWTLVVILLSLLCEKLIGFLLDRLYWMVSQMEPELTRTSEKASSGSFAFRVDHLTKKYGDHVIFSDLCFDVKKRETVVLTGESGSGKTTLLKILCGIEKISESNQTIIENQLLEQDHSSGQEEGRLKISGRKYMVFQENRLHEKNTVRINLLTTAEPSKIKFAEEWMKELLPDVSIDKRVSELSGGMKRRLEIVRAFLSDSEILLLDEPFAGLDENNRMRVMDFIKEHQENRTVIISTHSIKDVPDLEQRSVKEIFLNKVK